MDKPDSSPYNFQAEPGVTDATYQDFVAPILAGLGVGKAVSAGVKALPGTVNAVRAAIVSSPVVQELSRPEVEAQIERFLSSAQKIGDYARVFKYKALKTAMEQKQLDPDEVFDLLMKIHYTD
jgi:hypothetical protein